MDIIGYNDVNPRAPFGAHGETEGPIAKGAVMSEPRAIPDEERPFIPEETLPAKESTDFDADPVVDEEDNPEPGDGSAQAH